MANRIPEDHSFCLVHFQWSRFRYYVLLNVRYPSKQGVVKAKALFGDTFTANLCVPGFIAAPPPPSTTAFLIPLYRTNAVAVCRDIANLGDCDLRASSHILNPYILEVYDNVAYIFSEIGGVSCSDPLTLNHCRGFQSEEFQNPYIQQLQFHQTMGYM